MQTRLKQHTAAMKRALFGALHRRAKCLPARPDSPWPQLIDACAKEWFLNLNMLWLLQENGLLKKLLKFHIPVSQIEPHTLYHVFDLLSARYPRIFKPISYDARLLMDEGSLKKLLADTAAALDGLAPHAEALGWMCQHYGHDARQAVFAGFKRQEKLDSHSLPAATQLFTPEWIVRYLLDNSLGRALLTALPQSLRPKLRDQLAYYVDLADERETARVPLEDITFIDPCAGSGNMLVYAYELFFAAYRIAGFSEDALPKRIISRHIFALDVDEGVLRVARFALLIKAGGFFGNGNLLAISGPEPSDIEAAPEALAVLLEAFAQAGGRGSLLRPKGLDLKAMTRAAASIREEGLRERCLHMARAASLLCGAYTVAATNPPYMGRRGLNHSIKEYLAEAYPLAKHDLFSAFMLRMREFCAPTGYIGMFTPYVWMFIGSFEALRRKLCDETRILSLIQFAYSAFEEATVPVCAYVAQNGGGTGAGVFFRLTGFCGGMEKQREALLPALTNQALPYVYKARPREFSQIPGAPFAYWAGPAMKAAYKRATLIGRAAAPRQGLATGDNARFVRLWHEVDARGLGLSIKNRQEAMESQKTWFPYNKGGDYRKWYGNTVHAVNWKEDGKEIRALTSCDGSPRARVQNVSYYFRAGITWSFISSAHFGARYTPPGALFDVSGSSIFPEREEDIPYLLAFLCSKPCAAYLAMLNPTLNFQVGDIARLPLIVDEGEKARVSALAEECIRIAKEDWDSFEASMEFKRHPLVRLKK